MTSGDVSYLLVGAVLGSCFLALGCFGGLVLSLWLREKWRAAPTLSSSVDELLQQKREQR